MASPNKKSDTIRQVEIIHASLGGLVLMCLILTGGLLLPVLGFNALNSPYVAAAVLITVAVGLAGLYRLNLHAHKIVRAQARLVDVLINSSGPGLSHFRQQGVVRPCL